MIASKIASMVKSTVLLCIGGMLLAACTDDKTHQANEKPEIVTGHFALRQVSDLQWSANWKLDQHVRQIELDRQLWSYQKQAWRFKTPGFVIQPCEDRPEVGCIGRTDGSLWNELTIHVSPWYELPDADYYAFSSFSDGGMAVFAGYFAGSAITAEGKAGLDLQATFEGATIVPPSDKPGHYFVYYGQGETETVSDMQLVIDPAIPARTIDVIKAALPAASGQIQGLLGKRTGKPLSVMLAGGELESRGGYSRKGGALSGQVMFTFKGRDLREELERSPDKIVTLVVHELVHVWQFELWPGIGARDPWVHEGMAAWLEDRLMNNSDDIQKRAAARRNACISGLRSSSVREAFSNRQFDLPYDCGAMIYGLLLPERADMDRFFREMRLLPDGIRDKEGETLVFHALKAAGLPPSRIAAVDDFLGKRHTDPALAVSALEEGLLN